MDLSFFIKEKVRYNSVPNDTSKIGLSSFAIGKGALAIGDYSYAFGNQAKATNRHSFVIGDGCYSSGARSFAMGYKSSTDSMNGSFIFSDYSKDTIIKSTSTNQMKLRFSGDTSSNYGAYEFYTDPSCTLGVRLDPYSSGWISMSSKYQKENVEHVNYNNILDGISKIDVYNWNYKKSPNKIKYIGPMAQDIYKHLRIGNDSNSINSINIDGINLAAIKGLIEKLNEKDSEIENLNRRIIDLESKYSEINSRINKLLDQTNHLNDDTKIDKNNFINIYPNPTNGGNQITIEYFINANSKNCNLKIFNSLNKEIFGSSLISNSNVNSINLDINHFVSGQYTCVIYCGTEILKSANFIINK